MRYLIRDEETADKQLLLSSYFEDQALFCRQVLPHWFPSFMPWPHRALLAILTRRADFLLNFGVEKWAEGDAEWTERDLDKIIRHFTYPTIPGDLQSPQKPIFIRRGDAVDMVLSKFTNIMMPRESAKTTVTNAALLYLILYQLVKYFVYISNTQLFADDQLASIKRELETNETIHFLWGDISPDKRDSNAWREDRIETLTGILGATKGRMSQIRGMNKFSMRPDFEIMDDIEDEDSVATPEQLAKTQKWFMKAVKPSLSKVKGEGRLVNLGTPQAPNDISQSHAKDPAFTTVRLGAMDMDGEPIWPRYMTKEKYEAEKISYARRGMLFEFGMEYGCTINAEDQAKFKAKHIQRYKLLTREEFLRDFPIRALCIDPAISKKRAACPSALSVIGMNEFGFFHVFAFHMQVGMTPREQVDKYFEFSKLGACNRHGFEAVSYQAALGHLIREDMMRKQQFFEINEIYPGNDISKHQRIEGIIQPRTSAELFTFNERWPELEIQFLHWPHAGYDGPDVLAMTVALLDPFAGLALPRTPVPEGTDPAAHDDTPEILRDVTMEELDYDYKEMGVP